jgi:hypothetical protein
MITASEIGRENSKHSSQRVQNDIDFENAKEILKKN